MKRGSRIFRILFPFIAVAIAICLLVSFGLHSVQVKHEHPGHPHANSAAPAHHHDDQQESKLALHDQFHKNEEKWFLLIILSLITFGFSARPEFLNVCWQHCLAYIGQEIKILSWRSVIFEYQTYLEQLFSRGVLNPKLF